MMRREDLEDVYTLSPMQEGILFQSLCAPESGVYIEQLLFTFRGELDVTAFERAWREVAARHPTLRSAFFWQDVKAPLQAVLRRTDLRLEQEDWRSLPPEGQEERLAALVQEDRRRGFDLSRAPLMRLTLLRCDDDLFRFFWRFHHLVLDGWSFSLVLQEVFTLYKAFWRGAPGDLPAAPPYRSYIAWLKQRDRVEAEGFWRRYLAGFRAATSIAVGPPPRVAPEGASHDRRQTDLADLADALRGAARRHQLTLNTLVQGAWALLLGRYSREDDIVFGMTVANRPPELAGAERMVGLMITTLPLRVEVALDAPLLPWLEDLSSLQNRARRFDDCSLVEIRGWSEVPQGMPLFESIVVFENVPMPRISLVEERLELESYAYDGRPHYPLNVVVLPGDELPVRIIYDRRRFDPAAVERMLGHLRTVLADLAAAPEKRLGEVAFLSPAERQQVLQESGGPAADAPVEAALHRLFEGWAERTPDAVAVVCGEQSWTYGELDRRAGRLARRLSSSGVGPEVRVGLLAERSLDMVAGIVGILKAGGAYVPLDPDSPTERLRFLLEDSATAVLLAHGAAARRLPVLDGLAVLSLEDPGLAAEGETAASAVTPDALAYVIYTSGSTGRPKGVMVSHANVARLFTATRAWFGFDAGDVWTLFHSFAFDFSVWEIWGALLHGGRLVVVPHSVSRSPEDFAGLLRREQVTVLNQTPSAFRELARAEAASGPGLALRWVLFGGEALEPRMLAPWWERHDADRPRLVNLYGITETTVHVTCRPLSPDDLAAPAASPIGTAIPDLEVCLLGVDLTPVPAGVAGEICVGGAGLSRGYLGRPELTAERFVPHPWGRRPGERLYRSGDLARRLPSGGLDYLGRLDHQVKVRGFRIELGEIEAALERHPAVAASAAVARQESGGEQRLIAYAVPAPGSEPQGPGALRLYLQEMFPDYMVPAAVVMIDTLPLTANGKLDRRALPETAGAAATARVQPRDTLELRLAELWETLLGVQPVGVTDTFFDLGGNSLLAMRLSARIHESFGRRLPPAVFFQESTIEQIAGLLKEEDPRPRPILVPLQRGGSKPPLFCVPPATGSPLCYLDLSRRLGAHRPLYGFQTPEPNGHGGLRVEEIAALYVRELRSVQPEGPYLLAGWSLGGVVAFEVAQQLRRMGQGIALLALLDSWAPTEGNKQPLRGGLDLFALFARSLALSTVDLEGAEGEDGRLGRILEEAKGRGVLPPHVELSELRRTFQVFRLNVEAVLGYEPRPYPERLVLLRASDGDAAVAAGGDPTLGWRELSPGQVEIEPVHGSHFTLLQEPHVETLSDRLRACLMALDAVPNIPAAP